MRYRFMATYRGIPYEAGVGPTDSDIVLFAACPPPEELGFQPATGHWRKAVTRAEVDAVWESKPSGVFGGEPCLVLDELGDQLHIGYPGHDPIQAERLGYCEVEPGVFEVLVNREDVAGITEERVDRRYPLGPTSPLAANSWPASRLPAWPASPAPLPSTAAPSTLTPSAAGPSTLTASAPGPSGLTPSTLTASAPGPSAPAWPAPVAMAPVAPVVPSAAAMPSAGGPLPPLPSFPAPASFPPASPRTSSVSVTQAAPMTSSAPVARMVNPMTISPAPVPPAPAPAWVAPPARRRHGGSDTGPSWAQTRQTFTELANLAAIPPAAYAVNEEVDGAICLLRTDTGFEVFTAVDGTRQEIRLFADEEAAYFYMFGLLTAEAVRDGRLIPPR
jgi:hypothetical protein